MKLIETDRGVVVMGDYWDYRLWKAEMAWDLAMRIIPDKTSSTGRWTEDTYLKHAQEALKQSKEVIDAIFIEGEA
jgi:hypothetical protein